MFRRTFHFSDIKHLLLAENQKRIEAEEKFLRLQKKCILLEAQNNELLTNARKSPVGGKPSAEKKTSPVRTEFTVSSASHCGQDRRSRASATRSSLHVRKLRQVCEVVSGKEVIGYEMTSMGRRSYRRPQLTSMDRAFGGDQKQQRWNSRQATRSVKEETASSDSSSGKVSRQARGTMHTQVPSKEAIKQRVLSGDDGKLWTAPPTVGDVFNFIIRAIGEALGSSPVVRTMNSHL